MGNLGNVWFEFNLKDDSFLKKLEADEAIAKRTTNTIMKMMDLQAKSSANADTRAAKEQLNAAKLQTIEEKRANAKLESDVRISESCTRRAAIESESAAKLNILAQKKLSLQIESDNKTEESLLRRTRLEAQSAAIVRNLNLQTAISAKRWEEERLMMAMQRKNLESQIAARNAQNLRQEAAAARQTELHAYRLQRAHITAAAATSNMSRVLSGQLPILSQLKSMAGAYVSIWAGVQFVRNLAAISGEFEMQQRSLEAMLQSSEAAAKIFAQVKNLAVQSPYQFKDLMTYVKQMSAFSIPVNELYDTTKRLADVASGLGVSMDRVVLAYGQVRAASVLRGQEIRQFSEMGVPIIEELAKRFSALEGRVVSVGEVFDKVSNRLVPFSMVKGIFDDLTSAGGKFYEMQEIQAQTLKGMISNLTDAYQIMLAEMGKDSDSLLKGSVNAMRVLMQNWKTVLALLKSVIAAYGVYKGLVLATNVYKKVALELIWSQAIGLSRMAAISQSISNTWSKMPISKHPWVLIAAAIASIGVYLYNAHQNALKLDRTLTKTVSEVKARTDLSLAAMAGLITKLKTTEQGTQKYADAIAELNRRYGEYLPNMLTEKDSLEDVEKQLKNVTRAIYEKAKAQAYSESISEVEAELSSRMTKAREKAINALTSKPVLGLIGQTLLSKEDANRLVDDIFNNIYASPQLYKDSEKVASMIMSLIAQKTNITTEQMSDNARNMNLLVNGAIAYANALNLVEVKMGEVLGTQYDMYNGQENLRQKESAINNAYRDQVNAINSKVYADSRNGESMQRVNDLLEAQKTKLFGLIAAYQEFGQWGLSREKEKEFSLLVETGPEWMTKVNSIVKDSKSLFVFKPQENEQLIDFVKRLKDEYDDLQEKAKLKMDTPESKKTTKERLAGILEIGKALAYDFTANKSDNTEDPVAKMLKERFELLKNARTEYEKLLKVMSAVDAKEKLSASIQYKKVDMTKLEGEDYKNLLKGLYDAAAKRQTDDAKSLRNAIGEYLFDIDQAEIEKKVKDLLDSVNKSVEDYTKKYQRYQKIFELTGDKEKAVRMSFGVDFNGKPDLVGYMKEQMKALAGTTGIDLSKDILSTDFKDLFANFEEAKRQLGESVIKDLETLWDKLQGHVESVMEKDYGLVDNITEELEGMRNVEVNMSGEGTELKISKVVSDTLKGYEDIDKKRREMLKKIANIEDANLREQMMKEYNANQYLFTQQESNLRKLQQQKLNDIAQSVVEDAMEAAGLLEVFKDMGDATFSELSKMKDVLSGLDEIDLSPDILAKLAKAGLITEKLRKQIELIVKNTKESIDERKWTEIGNDLGSAGDAAKSFGDALYDLGEASGNSGLSSLGDTIGSLGAVLTEASNLAKGIGEAITTGNPMGIINSVLSITTRFLEAEARHKEALKKLEEERLQVLREYNLELMKMELNFQAGGYIFGEASILKMATAVSTYKKATDDLRKAMAGSEQKTPNGFLSQIKNYFDSKTLERIKAMNNGLLGLYNITVTGKHHKGGLFGWGKGWYEENSILTEYKDLVDANGKLNIELAKTILNTRTMKDDQKAALQNLIDLAELGEDALKQLNDYLSSVFGSLGDDLTTAIVEAFRNGGDAAVEFGKAVDKVLEKMLQDMAYALYLQPIFDEAQKQIFELQKNSSDPTNDATRDKMIEILSSMFGTASGAIEAINSFLEESQKIGDKYGRNLFRQDTTTSSPLSNSVQGITEDTGDILASYINAVRGDVSVTRIFVGEIKVALDGHRELMNQQLAQLKAIEANTGEIAQVSNRILSLLDSVTKPGSGKKINI